MACGILSNCYYRGGADDCGTAGIQKIFVANYTGATVWTKDATGIITGATANNSFYEFQLKEETGSFTENVIGNAFGNISYEQLAEFVFINNRQEVSNRVDELAKAITTIIVLDENDKYWAMGFQKGVNVNGGTRTNGVAAADENTYRLNFRSTSRIPTAELDTAGTFETTLFAAC
jgi:hypothetical protein